MCQAEAIIARAPVISWDVDALMNAAAVVFSCALVYICGEKKEKDVRAAPLKMF